MKRILVADDSVTIQKVIALTFADEPFEVQSVGTGSEALELVKSWKPDIVLADVIMPQMNGYELCRAVKQLEETSSVPVLLLAGTFEAFDEEEAKTVGADGFITKPFESGELIEKVKTLLGVIPEISSAEAAPVSNGAADPVVPETVPEAVPEAAAPAVEAAPPKATEVAEPDIWDILSESGDDGQAQAGEGGAQAPAFGPIEDTGVVDVGSFDVGIGRPESQPPPVQTSTEASPEAPQIPEPSEVTPIIDVQPPTAPPAADQAQDMDEKSRVENMEKDFFGFETGAVEEVPGVDIIDDAVEEVTFEMEQPPDAPEVDAQEVSFVVPEPADSAAAVTGETVSPDFMAPETPSEPAPSFPEASPAVPAETLMDEGSMGEVMEDKAAPLEVPVPDTADIPGFAPEPVPAPEEPVDLDLQPDPEPPLELPVELAPELPEEFSPEPVAAPVTDAPVMPSVEPAVEVPVYDPPAAAPVLSGQVGPDDDTIKKIVEEKVEKIVWEVVPEMAEVIIREAIQKIKDGS